MDRCLFFILVSSVLLTFPALGQEKTDTEELFKQARDMGFHGNREAARSLCRVILKMKPAYQDVRIFLARTYAWDKQYDSAEVNLHKVLAAKPRHKDGLNALLDVYAWSDRPDSVIRYSDMGLGHHPNFEDYLYKKARAQEKVGDSKGAAITAKQLLDINPSHEKGRDLAKKLKLARMVNKASLNYAYDQFSVIFDPWHMVSLDLSRKTKFGSIIARTNYASRFNTDDIQFELDAYPKIISGTYAYLNVGYAPDTVFFPLFRAGGELHQKLPWSMESSFGFRYLNFVPTTVLIYTGSIGKYWKSYWFSFRPYITPKPASFSRSGNLIIRRYFQTADDYLGLVLGLGASPDEDFFAEAVRNFNNALKISLEYQKLLRSRYVFQIGAGYQYEERRHYNIARMSAKVGISTLF